MISYSLYRYLPQSATTAMNTHAADRALDFPELLLIEGKFYTISSVLFECRASVMPQRLPLRTITPVRWKYVAARSMWRSCV